MQCNAAKSGEVTLRGEHAGKRERGGGWVWQQRVAQGGGARSERVRVLVPSTVLVKDNSHKIRHQEFGAYIHGRRRRSRS